MEKFNLIMLKTMIYMIICYIAHKLSDDFLSGGIAMAMCIIASDVIDNRTKEE